MTKLTPAALAKIAARHNQVEQASKERPLTERGEATTHAHADRTALLAHIAALEASQTPADVPVKETLAQAARTIILALLPDVPNGLARRQANRFVEYLNAQCALEASQTPAAGDEAILLEELDVWADGQWTAGDISFLRELLKKAAAAIRLRALPPAEAVGEKP